MGKKYKSGGTFIERERLESEAYLSLNGFAPQLLTLILLKRQFENHGRKGKQKRICVNCGKLNITYSEFYNKYGVTQPRMTRAIDQLLEKGFLSIVYPGGTYRQDKAVYALSDNWIIWKPGMVFETRKKEVIERGFCKPKKQKSHT
jgi:DNA-binding transcriptional ArsR family regulator